MRLNPTLALVALLAGCNSSTRSVAILSPAPAGSTIAVQVYSNATMVSQAEVAKWAADLNLQFARDIQPAWGVNATFTVVQAWDRTSKTLLVEDHLTQYTFASPPQGCHDNTTAYVDVYQSQTQNGTPEATAGKEIIEVVLERACTGAVAPYAYPVGGVGASGPWVLHDFELPAYFGNSGTRYDYLGILKAPGSIAHGGLND